MNGTGASEEDNLEFEAKLVQLRRKHGLTQEQLSEKLYVSRAAVSKWESGRGFPNIDALKNISRVFQVPVDTLLSGDELIDLAESDNEKRLNRTITLVFALLDMLVSLFIVVPLYGEQQGDMIVLVNLLQYRSRTYIQLSFFVLLSLLSIHGLVELVLHSWDHRKMHHWLRIGSLSIHSLTILAFIATREPYANTFLFFLILIKGVLLFRKHRNA
jgi:transcriptional regulator with XRE-family HTH domain